MMSGLAQDLRYALRSLRHSPGFTAVALVTIALGIGINTAIFSVVNGIVLRALPYPEPEKLVSIWENHERRGGPANEWTGRMTFMDWREKSRSFTAMSAVDDWGPTLTGIDHPDVLNGSRVTVGYFSVLGVAPALGRAFLPEEEIPGNERVVVLSHALWQERFGGDPEILERTLTLDGQPYAIVGVQPPGFRGPIRPAAEIWSPMPLDRSRDDRGNYFLRVVGRLAPDATIESAGADMSRVAAAIAAENPEDYDGVEVALVPLRDTVVGPVRTPLLVLLGAVSLILLIACANVANLLLARGSVRRREMAIRAALGAGRARLIRQLLTESIVLSIGGGLLGLVLGVWGTDLLVRIAPAGMPRIDEIGLHPAVLLFTAAASVATGVLFGLAPAFSASGGASAETLHDRSGSLSARGGLRNALVVIELAMGMAVLAAAVLLLRSFAELRSVDPGFRVDGALSARLFLPTARYQAPEQIIDLIQRLESRAGALPGVTASGAVTVLPLTGLVNDISFGIEGRMPEPGREPAADLQRATPGAFRAMGIPLIVGRLFDERDRIGATGVALISEWMADHYFPGEDPVGKRIKVGPVREPDSPWWTIVGVVGSVRSRALDSVPEPEIYLAATQRPGRGWSLVLRTEADAASLVPALRDAVRSLDPDLAISQVATLEDLFSESLSSQRFMIWLLGAFALLAVVLGAIGIYGVMVFVVSRTTHDIGIRMALGATPAHILRAVMRGGLVLTLLGVVLGLAGAYASSRVLSGLVYQVSPNDPLTLLIAAVLLAATSAFACYWPARRATRVDPVIALRSE